MDGHLINSSSKAMILAELARQREKRGASRTRSEYFSKDHKDQPKSTKPALISR
jgi:hypothetical protein